MSQNSVAIVTGASRGIGRGIALLLARNGFSVATAATRAEDDRSLDSFLAELDETGSDSVYIKTDISKEDDRRNLIDTVYDKYGRLDILVNNAGVAPVIRTDLLEMTEESLDRLLDINLKGTFFLTQYASKQMIKSESDKPRVIINITSISAETSSISRGEYCISKAAISMMTKLFADRLAQYGICVYELRPGIINTDMISTVKGKYDLLIDEGLLPIKRIGQPEDIAKVVLALAKGYFAYSTGQVINIDGGFHISRL